ncbi:MAG: LD-carboxypeptidase [Balneola sp.]|nr:MAG: LD-carboxypeptidase [Balneola sp.]
MAFSRKDFIARLGAFSLFGILPAFSGFESSSSEIIKPKRIKRGATLGLVAPGSPIYNPNDFENMITSLEGLGYTLVLGKHVKDRKGYLAGEDEDRVQDIMDMFSDDTIDAILCTRGGWGSNRILPMVDFELIKNNPKPFIGFSDITSLLLAIYKNTGLITFHGPVGKSDWNSFTVDSWDEVLINAKKAHYEIPEDQEDTFTITPGVTEGILLGGNLTVLTSMIGSDYLPDFEGAILFFEDIGEDVYRVDRMLTQLKLSGILNKINGFVFGKCTDCSSGSNSLPLKEVLNDHIGGLNIPAFYGAMISHEDRNITLPIGIKAQMDAELKTIQLLEAAVR